MRNATERHFDTLKAHTYTGQVVTYGGGYTWGCSCGAQGAKVWRHPGYKAYYVDQQAAAIRRSHLLHAKAEA